MFRSFLVIYLFIYMLIYYLYKIVTSEEIMKDAQYMYFVPDCTSTLERCTVKSRIYLGCTCLIMYMYTVHLRQ